MEKTSGSVFGNGQGLVEYALLLALIVIGIILSLNLMGVSLADVYCKAASGISGGTACQAKLLTTYCEDSFGGDSSSWQNVSGAPTVQNGQMCFQKSSQLLNKCSLKMPQSDYSINLNGATLQNPGRGYGVYFRSTLTASGLNGYAFQYDPGAGNVLLIRRWVNGREVNPPIARVPINSTIYNAPHDFKIDVKGDTFIVFMDGVQVMTAKDGTYPSGGTGLRFWDNTPTTCMNDFSIGQLP
jgi:hypothetical protein